MNDPIKHIEELAKTARREKAPEVNVSGKVLASIKETVHLEEDTTLSWVAAFSAVAAVVAIAAMLPVYTNFSDPLLAMMYDLTWSLI
jgi:hypothetical protein